MSWANGEPCEKAIRLDGNQHEWKDVSELRNHLQSFLSPGRNANGGFLAMFLFYLMQNPLIFARLRNEVVYKYGYDTQVPFSELDSSEYLHFCILEALRLSPPLPAFTRNAAKDVVLPKGGGNDMQSPILIRKGSTIVICLEALHVRPDLWGDDADCFNPDRWSGYRFDWSFLPFSKGRRQCIGQQLALAQIKYVIVRLLQNFDGIKSVEDNVTMSKQVDLSTKPILNSRVRLHRAKVRERT